MVTAAWGDPRVTGAWALLTGVPDPEIPSVSVLDLGMVRDVRRDGEQLVVELTPTFLGCPALPLLRRSIAEWLAPLGPVRVEVVLDDAWTTERITEQGRTRLRLAGFAPPAREGEAPSVACAACGSKDTVLESPFGPVPCRAIHYCRACHQPFEGFRRV